MSNAFGHNLVFGFGEEVTFATPVSPTVFLEVTEESLLGKHAHANKPALRELSQRRKVLGKKSVEGGFGFQMPLEGAEKLLKHALGAVSSVQAGDGNYAHTFTPANTLPVGLTFRVERDPTNGIIYTYSGCQISKLTLSQKAEDFLITNIEVMGADWVSGGGPAVPTYPTPKLLDWAMLTTATVNGVALNPEEIELTIENVLQSDRYKLGSRTRRGFGRNAPRKIGLKITAELDSTTLQSLYDTGNTAAVVLKWDATPPGGDEAYLQITLPKCVLQGEHPTTKDAGVYKQTLNLEAYINAALNDEIEVVLVNETVSV